MRFASGATLACLGAGTANAAEKRVAIDLSTGGSAATNPFLSTGPNGGAASAFIEIAPQFSQKDEISTVSLRGNVRLDQYSRRYDRDESAAVSLDVTRQLSETMTLRGGASARSNRSSAQDILTERAVELVAVPGLQPSQNDVSYIGLRTRTLSLAANVGATFRLGPKDTVDTDVATGLYKFMDPQFADYRYANQQLGYSRWLSERTGLKASIGLGEIDYLGRKAGDALIVSPLVGMETQLAGELSASVQVGLSFTSIRPITGARKHGAGLALRASLCRNRLSGRLCLNANRSSQPTALGDVTTLTAVGASLGRRLGPKDDIQLGINLSRSSGSSSSTGHPAFLGASLDLNHEVRRRFSLFAGLKYADIYDSGAARRANYQVRAGLRYHFGEEK